MDSTPTEGTLLCKELPSAIHKQLLKMRRQAAIDLKAFKIVWLQMGDVNHDEMKDESNRIWHNFFKK